ncbi:MAG: hypothetical protein WBW31_13920, partial [Candidatus Sulfotelmatobacter sp.]
LDVGEASFGLMSSAPKRPGDDACGLDASLGELYSDAADFLDRPADMAKASMTSETWRCQPCQERVSL